MEQDMDHRPPVPEDTRDVPPGYARVGYKIIKREWPNVVNGSIPLSELDNEEIVRLKLRRLDGTFAEGPGPRIIPRDLAQQHARELVLRNDQLMKEVILKSTKVFIDIVENDTADPKDRMKAAQYLHDRILGKVPDKVQITAEVKPWQGLVSGILTDDGEQDDSTDSEMKQIEPPKR